jgi:hypothetical protein
VIVNMRKGSSSSRVAPFTGSSDKQRCRAAEEPFNFLFLFFSSPSFVIPATLLDNRHEVDAYLPPTALRLNAGR